jgi:hypothetical protein
VADRERIGKKITKGEKKGETGTGEKQHIHAICKCGMRRFSQKC